MLNRRSGAVAAALATAAGLLVPVLSAGPAHAVTRDRHKLVVLAGAAEYLAYAEYSTTSAGEPDYARGSLHLLLANGTERSLGPTPGDAAPQTATGYRYSIVGRMLTDYSSTDPSQVRWWNLATGSTGVASLPLGATWQGSSPDGWIEVDAAQQTLADQSTTGTVTSYGQPIPGSLLDLGGIAAVSGPDGVVTRSTDGQLAYQSWLTPSFVVPLNGGQVLGSAAFRCDSVSASIAGCVDPVPGAATWDHVAVPLDGSPARTYTGCPSEDVAVRTQLIYACGTPAQPRFGGSSGAVQQSPATVLAAAGVSAFGNFTTAGPAQQAIITLPTATSATKVLVNLAKIPLAAVAELDAASLRTAANAVEASALTTGALSEPLATTLPAQILLESSNALITAALAVDPSRAPRDTTAVMGPVPSHLAHPTTHPPRHNNITRTRTLGLFTHALGDRGAVGFGLHRLHDGAHPAGLQRADGVYVDPTLAGLESPTIGMVALRTAMSKLGQPYVWAAAGPSTFDCSGLVQWAYAHAGIWLTHFSGDQFNEGRKLPARDILPGDLIMFDHLVGHHEVIHHVAFYLGAGWMLNAPHTGQYVDVVPVPSDVAGIVRP